MELEFLDSDYIENYTGETWKEQKKMLLEKYQKKYADYKIKITRIKTDTIGLRSFIVEGKR